MLARDINARMNELGGKRKALEEALRGQRPLDTEARCSLMEEHRTLGQVERHLANERLRSLEPRERVAISRVSEFVPGDLVDPVVFECTKGTDGLG